MPINGSIAIIADDLTGANDTALQFFMRGSNTEIIFNTEIAFQNHLNVETWALTTETRNEEPMDAAKKVWELSKELGDLLSVEKYYKKIDSTLRGNIAVEVLAMLEAIKYDAAVIAPAFIQEGRMTIGGYQLLKGIPVERTDAARDTYAPIYDSYIPDILKSQLNENLGDLIKTIGFKTVSKGAGPIVASLNELISSGKKLIVVDAVSAVDLEQIALAVNKSQFKILPVGSAGFANALSQIWIAERETEELKKQMPILPKLILSGSKTSITASQLNRLRADDEIENTYFIDLKLSDILNPDIQAMAKRIVQNFGEDNIVCVHVSNLEKEILTAKGAEDILIDNGINQEELGQKITDYLAELAINVNSLASFILVTIGGETSCKCLTGLDSKYLQVVDTILPAISLSMDSKARFIVTKSGNMGSISALVDIINYFRHHE